jgi:4-aminobutyrate aminotransferase-like enzyme
MSDTTTTAPKLPAFDHVPAPYTGPTREEVMNLRRHYLTPALLTFYRDPLMIVEGSMQYVYDETGRRYLDAFAGIVTVSVGHCHPKVVEAVREQNERLQHTTTIYLHPNIALYAKRLAETFPAGSGLDVTYFVNSGSEANDLAVMMARAFTGNFDIIALRNAYHGGSPAAMALTAHATWKFNVPHSFGVHHAALPDCFHGPWGYDDRDAGPRYAEDVASLVRHATSGKVAGFICEPIQGVGGVVEMPPGYLARVYEIIRAAGGVCIADEVQTGFGRTGDGFWGFESHGVVPDIVTMAKGIGNGCPLAACVTRAEIAATLTGANPGAGGFARRAAARRAPRAAAIAPADRRRSRPRADGRGRARGRPGLAGAGDGADGERARTHEGAGTARRQGRFLRQRPADQAADVPGRGRHRLHARGARRRDRRGGGGVARHVRLSGGQECRVP